MALWDTGPSGGTYTNFEGTSFTQTGTWTDQYGSFPIYQRQTASSVAIAPSAVSASTGVSPLETSYALYGHIVPLSVFGFGRIGGEIISGPWIENGLASFIISFGVPADPSGTRDIREIAFDSEVVWSSNGATGVTTTAGGTFTTEAFTCRFYQGTLTQAADTLESTHFGVNAVAYRPQILLAFSNLPLAHTKFGKIPYVAAVIGDGTGNDVNLGEAFERLANSPWCWGSTIGPTKFDTTGVTDGLVSGGMIIAWDTEFLQLIQQFGRFYPNWDILQTDKLRIVDRGANVSPDIIFTTASLMGNIAVSRQGEDLIKKDLELSTIDPAADYTIVPSTAQRPRDPVAVTTSVGRDSAYLPVIMDSSHRISIVTYAKYHEEQARKQITATAMIVGLEIEPGDLVAISGVGSDFHDEVFKVSETLHGINYSVEFTGQSILRCNTTGGTSFPAFVNDSGSTATNSTSVYTGTLPPSRVVGNLLIFYFQVESTTNNPTVSAGWTAIDTFGFGGATLRYGAYYRYVTGSETAPTLTWAGGGQAVGLIAQYSGTAVSSPVVAGSKNGALTGTSITSTAINSSAANSLIISATWNGEAIACSKPSGFTNEDLGQFNNLYGSLRLCEVEISAAGATSGPVSTTQVTSVPWGTLLFEIKAA